MQTQSSTANIFPITIDPAQKPLNRASIDRHSASFSLTPHSASIFDALWTYAIDGIRLTDENGTIVAVNKAFCELVEMKENELVGKSFTVIYQNSIDKERLLSTYKMIFTTGLYQTLYELRPILRSGKSLEVETHATCIVTANSEKLLLTQFRDITERRKTEKIIQESELKYRGLFANSIQPMFESTVDGKITNANKSFLRLLGYQSFDEIVNLNLQRDVYLQGDVHKDIAIILNSRGYIRNIEVQLKRKTGKTITVVENARALLDETGTIIGIEGVFEDVTAKKHLEEKLTRVVKALEDSKHKLTEINAQKNKLLSILSHDLRSPFTSILGFCDILIRENDTLTTDERIEYTKYIFEAAQDQLTTVNNLLDWTRIESGRIHYDLKDQDIHRIVERALTSLFGLARKKEIHLINRVPHNTFVHGDSQLLLQLFNNLISNSLKFTPADGGVFIELAKEDKSTWTIAVRDTGIGIPESDIPKLFKIDEKYSRKGLNGERGTGLGLPVCYEIMQNHHGYISVESKYGQGTTFYLQFPKVILQPGKTILLVDDEQGIRTLHSKYIHRILPDIKIVHASDGEEAIELAQSINPLMIITDHDMPNINGYELVKLLKENTITQSIPIIYITGYDSKAIRSSLTALGITTILSKPVSQEQFEIVLNKYK